MIRMRILAAALLLLSPWTLSAQMKLSVKQLVEMVRSSVELKHPDKKVAEFLEKVRLTQKLEMGQVEDLQASGAGPRTLAALEALVDQSKDLTAPPVVKAPLRAEIPPPSPAEQKQVLEDVKRYARNYVNNLPDFLCLQVTRRYFDPSGLEFWRKYDEIATRVTYVDDKEEYKVVTINNRFTDSSVEKLGGASSTGEFGSLMRMVFAPETKAEFRWLRWGKMRGRVTHVFEYEVAKRDSQWTINHYAAGTYQPGIKGLVYVDRDTSMILTITLQATDIPASFPLNEASTNLHFDFTKIGDEEYLLPLRANIRMREGRLLVDNRIEFRRYRKFSADAVITFDADIPEALPEDPEEDIINKQ